MPAGTAGDLTNGLTVEFDEDLIIHVRNVDASPAAVVFVTPATVEGLAIEDFSLTVGPSETYVLSDFPSHTFRQPDNSIYINVTSSNWRFNAFK